MNGELPNTPLFAGLSVVQHFERSRSYDTALLAIEGIIIAGVGNDDVRGLRAAMLHSYCVRIGAIIAGCEPADREELLTIARGEIAEAADIVRMLRS